MNLCVRCACVCMSCHLCTITYSFLRCERHVFHLGPHLKCPWQSVSLMLALACSVSATSSSGIQLLTMRAHLKVPGQHSPLDCLAPACSVSATSSSSIQLLTMRAHIKNLWHSVSLMLAPACSVSATSSSWTTRQASSCSHMRAGNCATPSSQVETDAESDLVVVLLWRSGV